MSRAAAPTLVADAWREGYAACAQAMGDQPVEVREQAARDLDDLVRTVDYRSKKAECYFGALAYLTDRHQATDLPRRTTP